MENETPDAPRLPLHLLHGEHRWTGHEHRAPHPQRATVLAVILVILGVILLIWQHDIFAALVMMLFGIVVFIHARREPPLVDVHIGPHGVVVDDKHYTIGQIKSFCIHHEPLYNIKELSLHLKSHWHPYVIVPLTDQNPTHIRRVLLPHIPEEHHQESFGMVLMRVFGL